MQPPAALDLRVLAELAALDPGGVDGLVVDLLHTYIEESRGQWLQLLEAWERHDAQGVRRHAHSLKGSSGAVGCVAMAVACGCLEQTLRAGQWPADRDIRDGETTLDRTHRALRGHLDKHGL